MSAYTTCPSCHEATMDVDTHDCYECGFSVAKLQARIAELEQRAERAERERDEARADADMAWSTLIALAEKLGIDAQAARAEPGKPSDVYMKQLSEARAEVERLRAGGCVRDQRTTQHCAVAEDALAKAERLRAALRRIEAGPPVSLRALARAALAEDT